MYGMMHVRPDARDDEVVAQYHAPEVFGPLHVLDRRALVRDVGRARRGMPFNAYLVELRCTGRTWVESWRMLGGLHGGHVTTAKLLTGGACAIFESSGRNASTFHVREVSGAPRFDRVCCTDRVSNCIDGGDVVYSTWSDRVVAACTRSGTVVFSHHDRAVAVPALVGERL